MHYTSNNCYYIIFVALSPKLLPLYSYNKRSKLMHWSLLAQFYILGTQPSGPIQKPQKRESYQKQICLKDVNEAYDDEARKIQKEVHTKTDKNKK